MGLGICVLTACPGGGGGGTGTAGTTDDLTTTTMDGTSTATPTGTTAPPTTTDSATGTTAEPTTTGGGDPLTDCQTWYGEFPKQLEKQCTCEVESGVYPDMRTCLADFVPVNGDCECPVFAADPANASWLECRAAAEQASTACMATVACDDVAGEEMCVDAFFMFDCGLPTKVSQGEIDLQCYGSTAFMCGSGERIPAAYTCDAEPDCVDMSDEAMCP